MWKVGMIMMSKTNYTPSQKAHHRGYDEQNQLPRPVQPLHPV